MVTWVTVFVVPRSKRSHCPSPLADQWVARLPSTVFPGRLPSWVLAVTAPPGGVMSGLPGTPVAVGLGVGVGVDGGLPVGVAVGVGVGEGIDAGAAETANTLISVTLFQVLVPPALSVAPCPT